jgi:hypothetical protein
VKISIESIKCDKWVIKQKRICAEKGWFWMNRDEKSSAVWFRRNQNPKIPANP